MARSVIEDGIYSKLVADTSAGTFYDDLGGRISLDEGPDNRTLPHAVIRVVTDVPARAFPGKRDVDAEFDIDLFGTRGARIHATNTKLFALLDNSTITISGFNGARVQCLETGFTTFDDERQQITSRWRVHATEQ